MVQKAHATVWEEVVSAGQRLSRFPPEPPPPINTLHLDTLCTDSASAGHLCNTPLVCSMAAFIDRVWVCAVHW